MGLEFLFLVTFTAGAFVLMFGEIESKQTLRKEKSRAIEIGHMGSWGSWLLLRSMMQEKLVVCLSYLGWRKAQAQASCASTCSPKLKSSAACWCGVPRSSLLTFLFSSRSVPDILSVCRGSTGLLTTPWACQLAGVPAFSIRKQAGSFYSAWAMSCLGACVCPTSEKTGIGPLKCIQLSTF